MRRESKDTKCKVCSTNIVYQGRGRRRMYCDGCAAQHLTRQNLADRLAFNNHASMSVDELLKIVGYC